MFVPLRVGLSLRETSLRSVATTALVISPTSKLGQAPFISNMAADSANHRQSCGSPETRNVRSKNRPTLLFQALTWLILNITKSNLQEC